MALSTTELRTAVRASISSFVSAYKDATDSKNATILSRCQTPDCMRTIRPKSMLMTFGLDPEKSEDATTYNARMAGELSLLTSARANILEDSVVIDTEAKRASFRSDHYLVLKGQEEVLLEFAWILDFEVVKEEDNLVAKINHIVEIIDTAECVRYVQLMMKVVEEQKARAS
ncbi:hypothetical protein F5Y16DRAFT_77168 [Xylariaceae sp. FL0255]|nr:hypothetical protein F5Y16DRAFT_77168 [Xylariaceae sp. FL0255]